MIVDLIIYDLNLAYIFLIGFFVENGWMKDNGWLGWFYKAHIAYPSIPDCSSDNV